MANKMKSDALLRAMDAAGFVVKALSGSGVVVKTVTLINARPVIRVEHCGYCDKMIHEGRAAYLEFGCGHHGKYRQGQFYSSGCKVVWSEPVH